jgi:hypothetical protein
MTLSVVMLSVILLSAVLVSVILPTVILLTPIELVVNQSMVFPAFSPKRRLSFKNISIKVIYIQFNT